MQVLLKVFSGWEWTNLATDEVRLRRASAAACAALQLAGPRLLPLCPPRLLPLQHLVFSLVERAQQLGWFPVVPVLQMAVAADPEVVRRM